MCETRMSEERVGMGRDQKEKTLVPATGGQRPYEVVWAACWPLPQSVSQSVSQPRRVSCPACLGHRAIALVPCRGVRLAGPVLPALGRGAGSARARPDGDRECSKQVGLLFPMRRACLSAGWATSTSARKPISRRRTRTRRTRSRVAWVSEALAARLSRAGWGVGGCAVNSPAIVVSHSFPMGCHDTRSRPRVPTPRRTRPALSFRFGPGPRVSRTHHSPSQRSQCPSRTERAMVPFPT